jgi:predicted nucleotide-binding protein
MKELYTFIKQGKALLEIEEPVEAHSQFGHWMGSVRNWISIQSPQSTLIKQWDDIGTSTLLVGSRYYNDFASWKIFKRVVQSRVNWLEKLASETKKAKDGSITVPRPQAPMKKSPQKILVYGEDNGLKNSVSSFLKKLGLIPVEVINQAGSGSLLKNTELSFSEIRYALFLLSEERDPFGALNATVPYSDRSSSYLLMELGFLIGKLGHNRVCVITEHGHGLPPEIQDIPVVRVDPEDSWKMILATTMKKAGMPMDLNLVL